LPPTLWTADEHPPGGEHVRREMEERRQRLYRLQAIVLRRTDVGEADRLLTVLSAEQGKRQLLAKGARKTLSRKAGHIELFTRTHLLVARARTWDIISQAEMAAAYPRLRQDLMRTTYAYYVAEMVDRFTEEGEEVLPLFELVRETLERLDAGDDPYLVVRFFDLHLLALAGYQPQFFLCVRCRSDLQPVTNYFHPEDGGVLCPRCGEGLASAEPVALNTLKVLRFLQTHEYEAVSRLRLSEGVRVEAEQLLYRYIVYVLERRLKTVDFLWSLRRQMGWAA
jgi:DNA repair protein RecO (recombination protein O)